LASGVAASSIKTSGNALTIATMVFTSLQSEL
jgi:hypothetical protein